MVDIWWAFTSPYRSFAIQDASGAWGLLVLAVAMAAGGWIGTHVAVTKGEGAIRLVLNIALVVLIVKLLL